MASNTVFSQHPHGRYGSSSAPGADSRTSAVHTSGGGGAVSKEYEWKLVEVLDAAGRRYLMDEETKVCARVCVRERE